MKQRCGRVIEKCEKNDQYLEANLQEIGGGAVEDMPPMAWAWEWDPGQPCGGL